MVDIQEIPLDIPDSQPDISENQTDIPEFQPDIPEIVEETPVPKKAKAKGRPTGAKNKQPSKPRAKRVIIQEPVVDDSPQYEPSSPRRNLPIPEFGVNDVAVEILHLLNGRYRRDSVR